MRSPTTQLSFLAALVCPALAFAAASPADISRAVGMVFAGDAGAAGGDVNADGRAGAADVVGVVLGLRSPTQPGPYGVGVQRMSFTKQSVTMPEQQRVLLTEIWYPGPPGTGPTGHSPGGLMNAPFADGVDHLPLVMFSHGSCGYQEQSVSFTSVLASYGFVVAAPPHPGNTTSDCFAGLNTPEAEADSLANRPADIMFVIDSLLDLNADPASFFYGAIDPNRIGMSGHSFGGLTTLLVSAMDSRVIAGLAMAPAAQGFEDQISSIHVPMMTEVGTLDSLRPQATLTYSLLDAPRYLVEIDDMTHAAFADFCPDCTSTTLTLAEAHPIVLRYAIPFLVRWVAGAQQFDAFLDPAVAPPGVTFSADAADS
jgi:predicted dienelactone hydrolase